MHGVDLYIVKYSKEYLKKVETLLLSQFSPNYIGNLNELSTQKYFDKLIRYGILENEKIYHFWKKTLTKTMKS